MIIECLIGIAVFTPQFLSEYKTCQWYQEAAEITQPYHHAFDLYLEEEDYIWAIATTFCESSGRQYAVSSAGAKGIWQYLDKTTNWLSEKLNENFNPYSPYDSSYLTAWILLNDINLNIDWQPSEHCWNKNLPKYLYNLHY